MRVCDCFEGEFEVASGFDHCSADCGRGWRRQAGRNKSRLCFEDLRREFQNRTGKIILKFSDLEVGIQSEIEEQQ